MPYYVSPYIGAGTNTNPFRPAGSDQAGWSAIDLRANKGITQDGGGFRYALLWLPPGSTDPVGAITLAVDKLETASAATKTWITTNTGLDVSQDVTMHDVIETLLVRPPSGWWNPITPARGRVEAWLGGERIVDFPVLAGGAISDNFNRANETPIAAPWTELSGSTGDMTLASNAAGRTTEGNLFAYYSHAAGWNADQSSSFLYATAITYNDWGPAVRVGSSGFSGYVYSQYIEGREIFKYVAGTFTSIEDAAGVSSVGTVYKIDVAGSTISYFDGGSANANSPATDTSLATVGNGAGVFWFKPSGSLDDFLATGEVGTTSSVTLIQIVSPLRW